MLIAASLCRRVEETPMAQCCEQSLSVGIGTGQLCMKCLLLYKREVVVSYRNISENGKILSLFTHPRVVPNLYVIFSHAATDHGSQTVKLLK